MEAGLIERLLAVPTVTSLLGTDGTAFNVAWYQRRRSLPFPALVLTKISRRRDYTHSGPDLLEISHVQCDCWADSAEASVAISKAVLAALEPPGVVTVTTRFGPAFLESERHIEPENLDDGAQAHRVILELSIWHEPA